MFNEPKPTIKCVGYNEYLNDSSDTAIQCNCTIPSGATKISYILQKYNRLNNSWSNVSNPSPNNEKYYLTSDFYGNKYRIQATASDSSTSKIGYSNEIDIPELINSELQFKFNDVRDDIVFRGKDKKGNINYITIPEVYSSFGQDDLSGSIILQQTTDRINWIDINDKKFDLNLKKYRNDSLKYAKLKANRVFSPLPYRDSLLRLKIIHTIGNYSVYKISNEICFINDLPRMNNQTTIVPSTLNDYGDIVIDTKFTLKWDNTIYDNLCQGRDKDNKFKLVLQKDTNILQINELKETMNSFTYDLSKKNLKRGDKFNIFLYPGDVLEYSEESAIKDTFLYALPPSFDFTSDKIKRINNDFTENDNLLFDDSIIFSWPEANNDTIDLYYKIYYQIDNGEYKYYKTVNQNDCTIFTDIINPDEVNDFDLRIKVVPNNLLVDGDPLYSNTYTRAKFDAYDPDISILTPDAFEIGKVTGITWKPYKYKNYSYEPIYRFTIKVYDKKKKRCDNFDIYDNIIIDKDKYSLSDKRNEFKGTNFTDMIINDNDDTLRNFIYNIPDGYYFRFYLSAIIEDNSDKNPSNVSGYINSHSPYYLKNSFPMITSFYSSANNSVNSILPNQAHTLYWDATDEDTKSLSYTLSYSLNGGEYKELLTNSKNKNYTHTNYSFKEGDILDYTLEVTDRCNFSFVKTLRLFVRQSQNILILKAPTLSSLCDNGKINVYSKTPTLFFVFSNKIKNINPTNAKMVIEINGDKYDSKHYSNYFNDSLYNINSKFNSSYIANSTTSYICKLPKALKQGDNKIEVYLKDDVVDYESDHMIYNINYNVFNKPVKDDIITSEYINKLLKAIMTLSLEYNNSYKDNKNRIAEIDKYLKNNIINPGEVIDNIIFEDMNTMLTNIYLYLNLTIGRKSSAEQLRFEIIDINFEEEKYINTIRINNLINYMSKL